MDYKHEYEEMVRRCKELHGSGNALTKAQMEIVCPQLAESEDERIRTRLIALVEAFGQGKYKDEMLAYLEKLKEFQFGYPGIYFYDGEKLHFQGNPAMEENQKEPNPSTPIEQEPAEKQDYSGLSELERAIHRGFLCAGVENVPVEIIKETAQECLAQMRPAEWSEEDEKMRQRIMDIIDTFGRVPSGEGKVQLRFCKEYLWLKSLRP